MTNWRGVIYVGVAVALDLLHHAVGRPEGLEPDGVVVVSIYVNPTQFAPSEDLATYPRDLPRDLALLEGAVRLLEVLVHHGIVPEGYG